MAIEYAVVRSGTLWCLFQCGQQIRVFESRLEAVENARSLADLIRAAAPVQVVIQSPTGELLAD